MTRDQLFALPVGTRLMIGDGRGEYVITETGDTLELRDKLGFPCRYEKTSVIENPPVEVIPGELDASEGVE